MKCYAQNKKRKRKKEGKRKNSLKTTTEKFPPVRKAEKKSRKAAEKSKKVVRPQQQSKRSTGDSTSKISEDTVPTTLAVGTSPASVESSNEIHSDSQRYSDCSYWSK